MKMYPVPGRAVFVGLLLVAGPNLFAAAIWNKTNTVGLWRHGTNWSSSPSAPTLASGGTYVTNRASKTVIIDAATPLTNLFINSLNVWAPPNYTNTLLLQDLGPVPLVVSNNSLDLRMRGAVVITNSSLVVTGNFIQFNLWAGTLTLESGSIVTHEPERVTNSISPLRVGRTNTAELHLRGGTMEVGMLSVGEAGLPNARSHGTVRMSAGELLVLGEFSIGNSVNCTGAVDLTGGFIHVPPGNTNVARIGDDGVGLMTVSNATVQLNNLSVGRHTHSLGTLALHAGGLLAALDDVSVGRFGGSTGQLFLAGGELRCTNQTLWIGREGRGEFIGSNGLVRAETLRVAGLATNGAYGTAFLAGATLTLASNLLIGVAPVTTGDVVIANGAITCTNVDASGFLDLSSGSLTLEGGSLAVDRLRLTNHAGQLRFNAGILHSADSVVANGLPFVIGDGVRPAVFVLGPGLHAFQDGLVVSSNATLTGCGQIVGTVLNQGGTITTSNCSPSGSPPHILQPPVSLTVTQNATAGFSVSADGTPAPTYQWRFTPPGGVETDLPGATGAALTIASAQAADIGTYRVIANNPSGSASASATLRVLVPPTLGGVTLTDTNATVFFPSVPMLIYVLEYKDDLDTPMWMPLTSGPGTGEVLVLEDPTPARPSRFYRVRVE